MSTRVCKAGSYFWKCFGSFSFNNFHLVDIKSSNKNTPKMISENIQTIHVLILGRKEKLGDG